MVKICRLCWQAVEAQAGAVQTAGLLFGLSVFVCLEKVSSVWWDVTAVDSMACIH